jgi:autophagy-related protein 13
MELDDTDTLRNELTPFRTATFSPPPPTPHPPLILEVTLSTHDLTPQQTLLLVSSQTGRRYTIETPSNRWLRGSEIVLERWCIDLVTPPRLGAPDLPVVYKKAVVLFRRVFTEARLLPVWRLKKRLGKVKLNNSLKIKVRVANGESSSGGKIHISVPIVDAQTREKITDEFSFGQIDTPAGYVIR